MPCLSPYPPSATEAVCILPLFDYDPNIAYDVVLYNDAGNTTFSGLVQFTARPTLASIDVCVDRGEFYAVAAWGVQCPIGTTITLRGARFALGQSSVVQYTPAGSRTVAVNLTGTVINSSTITSTLTALDAVTAAAVYGRYGTVRVVFTAADGTTSASNALTNDLYMPPETPVIAYITSSMCNSLSPLQLTNCRAMATITLTGSNLGPTQSDYQSLITSSPTAYLGENTLLSLGGVLTSTSGTSMEFTLSYFDDTTNVNTLQPKLVYTIFILRYGTANFNVRMNSNAFRISLTYVELTDDSGVSDGGMKLSGGAVAGIVVAGVVVVLLLVAGVWFVIRRSSAGSASASWSSKPSTTADGLTEALQSDGKHTSDNFTHVEMQ